MELHKILVPTDFSSHAERALEAAIELAKPSHAELHLLHVCHLPVQFALPEMPMIPASVWEELRESARRLLAERVRRVEKAGLSCHAHVSEGSPGPGIQSAIERLGIDLIVMGTRGSSGLQHLLLGSVAERTVRLSRCPVLTINADEAAKVLRLRTVVVPVDFSPASDKALEVACDLASSHGPAHLILAHGYYIPVELEQFLILRGKGGPLLEELSGEVTARLEQTLTRLQDRGISSEYTAVRANPEQLIVELARSRSADLIVMGTHGRRGFSRLLLGSVAERVVRTAPCPVLTVQPDAVGKS